LAMCQGPHYPALYYIFPNAAHDGDGTAADGDEQPVAEDYIDQTVTDYGENNNFVEVDYGAIAGLVNPHTAGTFELPNPAVGANAEFDLEWGDANTPDERPWDLVVTEPDGTFDEAFGVSVLDKIIYSGRENMAIRLLDIHVGELMADNNVADTWFAGQDAAGNEHFGLTYAFREDAVREDNIVRPTDGNFATCGNYDVYKAYLAANDNCYQKTDPDVLEWTDPPLSTDHLISLKPVDYIPDPMRRPYGFRLREGEDFDRPDGEASGLSFISDNAVVIQGNFNLHTETLPTLEEEFSDRLVFDQDPTTGDKKGGDFYKAFYERSTANAVFADSTQDKWRPSEVLGDAVYLLSDEFKDGFVEAGYVSDPPGDGDGDTGVFQYNNTNGSGLVSFQNMNRPADDDEEVPLAADILREDPNVLANADNNAPESPIYVSRDGDVYFTDGTTVSGTNPNPDFEYFPFDTFSGTPESGTYRVHNLAPAEETTINSLIISGIVPARDGQSYGGLHNFPRFNETWRDTDLQIAGGFFQLFFSHSSTGPWDMDAWEFDDPRPAAGDTNIGHYFPPNRIWGYDVALQYAQQPPISSRFVSVGVPRSEFYRELPVDDPYINNLRCAQLNGSPIDPNATCN
ncbi:MAG: hypothetical protein F6K42_27095, partial [Leptolyngbya sp. SIO1D8]|nr:hypothetical protein [Leptolyngbya sp. SIO1D8]